MSIFNLFGKKTNKSFNKEIREEMYRNNTMGYRDNTDKLNYQQVLLDRINAASAQYKQDHDLDAVIKEFEYAFITSDPPCKSSQNMKLVDFYIKAGQNDKAWGYLNKLIVTKEAPIENVRFAQARILKKEKKYVDALEMCLLGNYNKYSFNDNVFDKDIKTYANKLKLNQDQMDYLKYLVTQCKSESVLIDRYNAVIKEWGLI